MEVLFKQNEDVSFSSCGKIFLKFILNVVVAVWFYTFL